LGLSQVYGFCTQSGGGVDVESEAGKGATFTLRIPAALQATETAATPVADFQRLDGRPIDADVVYRYRQVGMRNSRAILRVHRST